MTGPNAVLDVDYLYQAHRRGPRPLTQPLIYRTRSGALLRPMMRVLEAVAGLHGGWRREPTLPLRRGFEHPPLMTGLALCTWPEGVRSQAQRNDLRRSVENFASSFTTPSIHIVPRNASSVLPIGWDKIEKACLVVEEPPVTPAALRPILRYLLATTDLGCDEGLLEQTGFVDSFSDLIAAREELPRLLQAFDERVLIGTDPVTQAFDPDAFETPEVAVRRLRGAPQTCLCEFIADPDEHALVALLTAYDARQTTMGWTPYRIVSDLYRITSRLLEDGLSASSPGKPTSIGNRARGAGDATILWAALVLAWDASFLRSLAEETGYRRGPSTLMTALEGLGRAFRAQWTSPDRADLLDGRWGALDATLHRRATSTADPLVRSRAHLVANLLAAVAARPGYGGWVRHLHAELIAATAFADVQDRKRNGPPEAAPQRKRRPPKPVLEQQTFGEISGRERAIEHLHRHIRANHWSNILLYGPDGVGKRTLALLYAKALLCTAADRDDAPCGHCDSCQGFTVTGEPQGVLEIDAKSDRLRADTDYVVAAVTGATFTRGWVVIVHHADQYDPDLFDRFLQPMEAENETAFVLLTNNPQGVRLAGQSRCDDLRVRPLPPVQAAAMLRMRCAARGQIYDDHAMALLVKLGRGLPGQLMKLDRALAHLPQVEHRAVRKVLRHANVDAARAIWPRLLAHDPRAMGALMWALGQDRTTCMALVHAALQGVYLSGLHGLPLPERASQPGSDTLQDMTASLHDHAQRLGHSSEAIWAMLAVAWLSERNTRDGPCRNEQHPHSA